MIPAEHTWSTAPRMLIRDMPQWTTVPIFGLSPSSDLSELQHQAPCDTQSRRGIQFSELSQFSQQELHPNPALTGPPWGLPGGDNSQSPSGVRAHPTYLAAS